MSDEIPKTIPIRGREDPFVIEEVIGEGGMGKVYRAHDPVTGDRLAVKVLGEIGDPTRFALESDVLSKLHHPNIVAYRSHGLTNDGHPYLAMEWVDGDDLERHLETANLTVEEALRVARAVADALAAAHAAGVIHRDLKPSNVILTRQTRAVKLVDFGIARASNVEGLTKTGQALGTPGYMSPEQARGLPVDARTDLFSLGCLLFRALGGRRPFAGSDIMQFATSLALEEPPLLRELAPSVPPDLEALVAQLLQKDPSLRPESALHVRQALDRITAGADRTAVAPTAAMPGARASGAAQQGSGGAARAIGSAPRITAGEKSTQPSAFERTALADAAATQRSADVPAGGSASAAPGRSRVLAFAGVAVLLVGGYLARGAFTGAKPLPAPAPSVPSAASSLPAFADASAPPAIDRAALDRACKRWAAAIAKNQRANGAFAGEERAPTSGWDTAQQLFALAEAHRACDGATVATLAAGVRALDELHIEKGWLGPRGMQVPAAERYGETPAAGWALLAAQTIADDTHDAAAAALATKAKAEILAARNPDGGFRERPKQAVAAGSSLYATALATWALKRTNAPESGAGQVWLEKAIDAEKPGTRELGFTDELAWIMHGTASTKALASTLVANCRPDESGACSRPTYDTGRIPILADGGGGDLIALWHPWATLAAATLAKDPTVDPDVRKSLDGIARWGSSELVSSIDVLGAAPAYKLSEYLIAVSELLDPK